MLTTEGTFYGSQIEVHQLLMGGKKEAVLGNAID